MGYSTFFHGHFDLSRKLTASETTTLELLENYEAAYPSDTPSYSLCKWTVREQGDKSILLHNDGEKFYEYVEWLEYIGKLFTEWGVMMNGKVIWHGEDVMDAGVLFVKDNKVWAKHICEMPEPDWTSTGA